MGRLGMEEGEPIEHRLVSNAIEKAQKRVEGHNFDIRKHLLEYDDVMNKQREVIYAQRRQILARQNPGRRPHGYGCRNWWTRSSRNTPPIRCRRSGTSKPLGTPSTNSSASGSPWKIWTATSVTCSTTWSKERFAAKSEEIGPELFQQLQQMIMLQIVDNHWKEHLLSMDHLRDGIGLRGYAQVDPLREYQREGYDMFMDLIHRIEADIGGHPVPPPGAAPS